MGIGFGGCSGDNGEQRRIFAVRYPGPHKANDMAILRGMEFKSKPRIFMAGDYGVFTRFGLAKRIYEGEDTICMCYVFRPLYKKGHELSVGEVEELIELCEHVALMASAKVKEASNVNVMLMTSVPTLAQSYCIDDLI